MKKEERVILQQRRLEEMKAFDKEFSQAMSRDFHHSLPLIAGVDEVGRGPLAGPVVAAAVILPWDFQVLGIDDSKKVTEKNRERLYLEIKEKALAYAIGIVDNIRIDEVNILEAAKEAMAQAIDGLSIKPARLLIDGLTLKDVSIPQTGIVKGDSLSLSIAAASILAKVTRDRMMVEYHQQYPNYSFDKNKGYGTKAHYAGLDSSGICSLHRKTFLRKYYENKRVKED